MKRKGGESNTTEKKAKQEPKVKRPCAVPQGSLEDDKVIYQWLIAPLELADFENEYLDQQLLCSTRGEPSYFQGKWEVAKLDSFLREREYFWGRHATVFDVSSPSDTTVDQLSCQRLSLSSITYALESLRFGYDTYNSVRSNTHFGC